jgi:hypothetical protein
MSHSTVLDKLRSLLDLRLVRTPRLKLRPGDANGGRRFAARAEEQILGGLLEGLTGVTKFYVDIGASDGLKLSNTATLAIRGWSGVAFEFDPGRVATFARAYRDLPEVRICRAKVTPKNVIAFLDSYAVPTGFGVLSLDIDSYDHFVLEALLARYRPKVIIAEINEKIPPPLDFTVLFDDAHGWDGSHFYGQSICRLAALAKRCGYAIHALEYNNAFLVDANAYGKRGLTAREAYEKGYLNRPDRLREFPWNRDVEAVLTLPAADAIEFLNRRFAPYAGRYSLSIGTDGPPL